MRKIKIPKVLKLSLIAVGSGLLFGGIVMIITGKNPINGYYYLIQGATMSLDRVGNILALGASLILTGLAVSFAFKTGLFNIGVPGQMFVGGMAAVIVGLTVNIPYGGTQILALLAAMLAGASWALVPGALKAKFEVNEVVATIMMNWIAYWVVYYTVAHEKFVGIFKTETMPVPMENTLRVGWLTDFFKGAHVSLGIFIALFVVVVVWWILEKTTLGYELKAVGLNRHASKYAGMKVNRNFIIAMMISGAIAGLAGAVYYIGYNRSMLSGALPSQGYDGIAIALLGANNPFGVALAALFFAFLYAGSGFMNVMANIPPELAQVVIAIVIYFAATSNGLDNLLLRISHPKRKKKKNIDEQIMKEEE